MSPIIEALSRLVHEKGEASEGKGGVVGRTKGLLASRRRLLRSTGGFIDSAGRPVASTGRLVARAVTSA
jgi:hypothetical protein